MAVSAPGDSPPEPSPGADSGIDPGMWARLMSYISPIGSAQAAPAPQPTSAPGPTNDLARQQALANAQAQLNAGNASNNTRPPTLGSTPPIISAGQIPTTLPPAGPAPAGPSPSGGIGSDANFPVMGAGGFPTTYAPPGQQPAQLDGSPAVPYPPPRPAAQPPAPMPVGAPTPPVPAAAVVGGSSGGQSPFVDLTYRLNIPAPAAVLATRVRFRRTSTPGRTSRVRHTPRPLALVWRRTSRPCGRSRNPAENANQRRQDSGERDGVGPAGNEQRAARLWTAATRHGLAHWSGLADLRRRPFRLPVIFIHSLTASRLTQ